MAVEEDLVTLVAGTAAITSIISTRMWPSRRPQGSAVPSLVYQRISTPRRSTHTGPSGLAWPRFQFSCWGATLNAASDLADQLRFALDGYQGTVGGTYFAGIHIANELDDEDTETGHWRRIVDYTVWHRETVG